MAISGVSTSSIGVSLRLAVARAQTDLARNQSEALSGRLADQGLALGTGTAQTTALARDMERLDNIRQTNGLASTRLSATQSSLKQMGAEAQTLLSALTLGTTSSAGRDAIAATAATALASVTGLLNSSVNGEYLFAGVNTDVQPVTAWTAGSPAKAAFDTAFQTRFGFPQTDARAGDITQADMTAFLDSVEDQFLGAGWNANWSDASDTPIQSRIALNETSATSVSANAAPIRKLVMAAAITAELLSGPAGTGARAAVTERARQLTAEAVSGLAETQAQTGVLQSRVKSASERLATQSGILKDSLTGLIGVDRYEASTRVADLLNQIETSYALTARIGQLSLAKFLP
ncbi:MAG: flagellar hook-associated family protein [Mesorhizobium amorphae]|nr:MAG: flagellar hook-associated family protein [Mesorhizobium amorphae]